MAMRLDPEKTRNSVSSHMNPAEICVSHIKEDPNPRIIFTSLDDLSLGGIAPPPGHDDRQNWTNDTSGISDAVFGSAPHSQKRSQKRPVAAGPQSRGGLS
jgi:hypothetical protein